MAAQQDWSTYHPPHLSHDMMKQRMRLGALLYRYVQEDDAKLTDIAFLTAVWDRLSAEQARPLIDPNE